WPRIRGPERSENCCCSAWEAVAVRRYLELYNARPAGGSPVHRIRVLFPSPPCPRVSFGLPPSMEGSFPPVPQSAMFDGSRQCRTAASPDRTGRDRNAHTPLVRRGRRSGLQAARPQHSSRPNDRVAASEFPPVPHPCRILCPQAPWAAARVSRCYWSKLPEGPVGRRAYVAESKLASPQPQFSPLRLRL